MQDLTDQQLLGDYAARRSEAAFAELVRRHIDLVFSAALRLVCDRHLAEDVTQSVFAALAQNARQLTDRPVLAGWLHRTTQNLAANVVRTDVRRRAREQEAVAMNELLGAEPAAAWQQIAPQLDAALGELSEPERDAVLLRYFERKSAREMAHCLGISDEAAQKRVTRAVERLREFFARRGVTVGASGLVVVISANAVQAAPVGLAVTISTAATLAGTTIVATATATAAKTIAMTTVQKTLLATTVAILAGAGIYEATQARQLRTESQTLRQQQAPLTDKVKQLQQERDAALATQATLQQENERLQKTLAEVPKLRGELARLLATPTAAPADAARLDPNDPATQAFLAARAKAEQISKCLQQMPDKAIPELKILTDVDWLRASTEAKLDTDADIRKALSQLRGLAKNHLPFGSSLWSYTHENNGELPTELAQLKPYVKSNLNDPRLDDASLDAIFERYQLLHTGKVKDYPPNTWFIVEKTSVDKDYDSRAKFGPGTGTIIATGLGETGDPDDKSY